MASPSDFRVYIHKISPEPLSVTLKNERGETLCRAPLGKRDPGKALNFNMATQPDGTYTVEIRGNRETVMKTFVMATPVPERILAVRR